MTVVVHASAALAWLLPTQATPAAWAFLRERRAHVAPAVFSWEVGNVLVERLNRGLYKPERWPVVLAEWAALEVTVAEPLDPKLLLNLAAEQRLSLFDASYLALAVELDSPLASRDAELLHAARRCGVRVHDLRDPA